MSMTSAQAETILRHPQVKLIPSWLTDEAKAVRSKGPHWWTGADKDVSADVVREVSAAVRS